MTSYGAIDGYQAAGGSFSESDRPAASISSIRATLHNVAARPWARVVAALFLGLLALSYYRNPPPGNQGTVDATPSAFNASEFHDENQQLFYDEQLVNHFDGDASSTWSHRYYKSTNYFEGPGHPIFLVIGGEGALERMLYPFINHHLAPHFGAAVIQPEHRFYGPYQPITGRTATVDELIELLTPQQAMADMVQLTKTFKEELGCAQYDRSSENYCPVISVGGSYPGIMSALFRIVYPDFVDISYAAGAPLRLHAQLADQNAMYDIVTRAAERLSPGCAKAVGSALDEAKELIKDAKSVKEALESMNLCVETAPKYITTTKTLSRDVMMSVGFSFADYDMDAYPPGKDLGLYRACQVFQDKDATSLEKVANFFQLSKVIEDGEEFRRRLTDKRDCFDLSIFLPDGKNARITTSDWSGAGGGNDGKMWDFQLCTTLIAPIGFSEESMFPTRKWTLEGLTEYCQMRYGEKVTPQPYALVRNMSFDDLVGIGASHILFTNGLQDMWSGGSYLEDLSDTILALNFENGAHHSDLTHAGPGDDDTDDIREGYVKITNILEKWLGDIKPEA
ncbi:hypothetical protein ACHAXT_005401 [Thalassiosira profunda]